MGRSVAVCRGRSTLEGGWNVAKESRVVRDAGPSERVGEAKKSDMKEVEGDGERFVGDRAPAEVDLDKVDDGAVTAVRGMCKMTLLGEECMTAALSAGTACLQRVAATGSVRAEGCER